MTFPQGLSVAAASFVFWVATVSVAAELAVGGVWDLLRIDYVRDIVEHLGYPTYLLTIMGVWKVPGAVALLIPRLVRLKEWVVRRCSDQLCLGGCFPPRRR